MVRKSPDPLIADFASVALVFCIILIVKIVVKQLFK